ncbi:unnamed protein product [Phytophthora lilii]|uniref:Unnamed protein product n=1 Tax=Phytophthora lilii TaxID=2077276 RepID=A0A9W7CLR4_9STRA|nr:unnamed protein product [Phytophthora lilii]
MLDYRPPQLQPQRDLLRGRFAVQAKLHEALLGDIWLCQDRQEDNRLVAVKRVHLELSRRALAHGLPIDDPCNEGHAVDTLRMLGPHENVVQVHQHFRENDSWFLVMEHCAGGDLCHTLERLPQNRLPEIQALPLFASIARGVRLVHANGIAHRDLSLENVLLAHTDGSIGIPKICDFGLSTKADQECCGLVGKPYYMAPEIVAGARYDPRAADVWSLGIMLFVMLTGSPLTRIASGNDPALIALKKFGVDAILDAWHLRNRVSIETVQLLVGMLKIDPTARFTVEDVVEHPALQLP